MTTLTEKALNEHIHIGRCRKSIVDTCKRQKRHDKGVSVDMPMSMTTLEDIGWP